MNMQNSRPSTLQYTTILTLPLFHSLASLGHCNSGLAVLFVNSTFPLWWSFTRHFDSNQIQMQQFSVTFKVFFFASFFTFSAISSVFVIKNYILNQAAFEIPPNSSSGNKPFNHFAKLSHDWKSIKVSSEQLSFQRSANCTNDSL